MLFELIPLAILTFEQSRLIGSCGPGAARAVEDDGGSGGGAHGPSGWGLAGADTGPHPSCSA